MFEQYPGSQNDYFADSYRSYVQDTRPIDCSVEVDPLFQFDAAFRAVPGNRTRLVELVRSLRDPDTDIADLFPTLSPAQRSQVLAESDDWTRVRMLRCFPFISSPAVSERTTIGVRTDGPPSQYRRGFLSAFNDRQQELGFLCFKVRSLRGNPTLALDLVVVESFDSVTTLGIGVTLTAIAELLGIARGVTMACLEAVPESVSFFERQGYANDGPAFATDESSALLQPMKKLLVDTTVDSSSMSLDRPPHTIHLLEGSWICDKAWAQVLDVSSRRACG